MTLDAVARKSDIDTSGASDASASHAAWSAPASPPPKPPANDTGGGTGDSATHVVKPGETLDALSARYGASSGEILKANPAVTDPNTIRAGQTLHIPLTSPGAAAPDTHVVAPGETLSGIAKHYGTSTYRLATANGIGNPDHLRAGQTLFVPGQPKPAASATPAPSSPATPPAPTPADQAHDLVAAAQAETDPAKSLAALSTGYAAAPTPVRTAVLADPGAQAIVGRAADWANAPLSSSDNAVFPEAKTAQAMQRLDQVTTGVDKDLAGAVADRALGGYQAFVKDPNNGGPLFGPQGMASLMDVGGRITGSGTGDHALAGFAGLGAWDGDAVRNSIAAGADPAYAIALAQSIKASGQSPSIVVDTINDGIAQRDLPKIGAGGSPEATLGVAKRMQAAGLDASGVIATANGGVQQFKDQVGKDVNALASHDAELGWVVQHDGGGMTSQQLNDAVAAYRKGKGADWNADDARLRQTVADDGSKLIGQLTALNGGAPTVPGAQGKADATLRTIVNDPAAGLAISTAIQTDPKLVEPKKVDSVVNLFSAAKVGDSGRKLTNELASSFIRRNVGQQLQSLDLTNPASVQEAKDVIAKLDSASFAKMIGVSSSDTSKAVKALEQAVDEVAADPTQEAAALGRFNDRLNKDASLLKAFNKSTAAGQMLRGVAVMFSGASLFNAAGKAKADPGNLQNDLAAVLGAAGFAQKNADLLVGLGAVSKDSAVGKFGGEWKLVGQAGASELIGGVSSVLDGVSAVRSGFGLGVPQDTGSAVFSGISAVGGGMSLLPAFGASAWLGPVGLGIAAVGVLGGLGYQQYKSAHEYEGASRDFLKAGGYGDAAASALSQRDGMLSGASGTASMPFLMKYAEMKHLSVGQVQHWVNGLSASQVDTLGACLRQTAGDAKGDVGQFTDGPAQTTVISGGGYPAIVTLSNTLGEFESNLAQSHVPLPP